jgi:alkyldihydroxyacetonephosphate synthase
MTTQARGPELSAALGKIIPADRVSCAPADRVSYARDAWPRTLIAIQHGVVAPKPPDVVVWPETTEEVAAIVRLANELRVPIVPYGAGSGVAGGALCIHGGIVVDVKRMNRMVALDEADLTATFEAGMNGDHLEHELGRHGYTLGHFPSSIMCSTFGGWLAARSAGQLSTKYGKIEDMALALEVVTGRGDVMTTGLAPRGAPGPDLTQLFIGSEGTLGIITRGTVRIARAPEKRIFSGWEFPRVDAGCEAIRRILQRGLRPSVVRLYDELDTITHRKGGDDHHPTRTPLERDLEAARIDPGRSRRGGKDSLLKGLRRALLKGALTRPTAVSLLNRAVETISPRVGSGCLLILGFEGGASLTEAEAKMAKTELLRAGGKDLGEGPGLHWYANRYRISWKQPRMFKNGTFVDTMEVATTWDRLLDLYRAVRAATERHAITLAHFSHAYPEGCSIYFSFAAAGEDLEDAQRRYDALWQAALSAVTRSGATISHHHGVGISKAAFMNEEHGEGMAIYRALKQVLDPNTVMNPGKMGL